MSNNREEIKTKLINIMLFIISLDESKEIDMHTIFKVMYRAEKIHIYRYGLKIAQDKYLALTFGPVPANSYDILKNARTNNSDFFEVEGFKTKAKTNPDIEDLSESEMECLSEAYGAIRPLDFPERTEDSHDEAYNSVGLNQVIPIIEIAKAAGANEELLKYIEICG